MLPKNEEISVRDGQINSYSSMSQVSLNVIHDCPWFEKDNLWTTHEKIVQDITT
jgi:hypothetical protein